MAVTHHDTVRNGIADYVVDSIDAAGPGTLEFLDGPGGAECATVTFAATAFGPASSGTATAAAIVSDTNAAGGVVANFVIKSGTPTELVYGNVLTSGGDINLSSLTVGSGDTVSMSALTYTAPL